MARCGSCVGWCNRSREFKQVEQIRSCRWANVLIEAEDVRRIILVLERDQPRIVLAVGSLNTILAFVAEIIGIDTAGGERPYGVPELARPGNVRFVVSRVVPDRDRKAIVEYPC